MLDFLTVPLSLFRDVTLKRAALWCGSISILVPTESMRRTSIAEASTVQYPTVSVSCSGQDCHQCDPKNMGENINIFCKKGNLTQKQQFSKFFSAFQLFTK